LADLAKIANKTALFHVFCRKKPDKLADYSQISKAVSGGLKMKTMQNYE
jgi:hypothetical protein